MDTLEIKVNGELFTDVTFRGDCVKKVLKFYSPHTWDGTGDSQFVKGLETWLNTNIFETDSELEVERAVVKLIEVCAKNPRSVEWCRF